MEIKDLELSMRAANLLKLNGIDTIEKFMALDAPTVLRWKNAGRRTWNEIRDMQRHVTQTRRRTSAPGQAAALIFQLNEMVPTLRRMGFFVGRNNDGLLRLFREVRKEDFDDISK